MIKMSKLLKIIELAYLKMLQKRQNSFLKDLRNPMRHNSKIRPRLKVTLLIFLVSFLFVLSFQQFYLHRYSTKTNKISASHPVKFMGTMIAEQNAIAVINERAMHVGDELYGLRIVAIHENKLDLKGPQGKMTLNVGSTYYL